jgi:hypothetical protein
LKKFKKMLFALALTYFPLLTVAIKCYTGYDPKNLLPYEDKEKDVCVRFAINCEDVGGCPNGIGQNGIAYNFGAFKKSDISKFEPASPLSYQDIYACKNL